MSSSRRQADIIRQRAMRTRRSRPSSDTTDQGSGDLRRCTTVTRSDTPPVQEPARDTPIITPGRSSFSQSVLSTLSRPRKNLLGSPIPKGKEIVITSSSESGKEMDVDEQEEQAPIVPFYPAAEEFGAGSSTSQFWRYPSTIPLDTGTVEGYQQSDEDEEETPPTSPLDRGDVEGSIETANLENPIFKEYSKKARKEINDLLGMGYTEEQALTAVEVKACREREKEVLAKMDMAAAAAAIRAMGFEGTCYPHVGTMKRLGIKRDVELLADACGLVGLLFTPQDTYVEESIDFLASVHLHLYDARIHSLTERDGGGYITFSVNGQGYRCTLKKIQQLFEFNDGAADYPMISRDEVNALWHMMTSKPVFDTSRSKGNWIRNPCISYFRRAVAHVLYARDTTGPINLSEAEILVSALKETITTMPNGEFIIGDTANASFAFILANHLMDYRKRAMRQIRRNNRKRISIGGPVCAIMRSCEIELHEDNNIGFRVMNVEYLEFQKMLKGQSGDNLLYRFRHPDREDAYIRLPCRHLTSIREGRNADFLPPLEALTDPGEYIPPPPEEEREAQPGEIPQGRDGQQFQPVQPARRGQRQSALKKMNKWLIRKVKGLLQNDKEKEQRIRTLEGRVSTLEQEPRALQRQRSETIPQTREQPPVQARHSSADTIRSARRRARRRGQTDLEEMQPAFESGGIEQVGPSDQPAYSASPDYPNPPEDRGECSASIIPLDTTTVEGNTHPALPRYQSGYQEDASGLRPEGLAIQSRTLYWRDPRETQDHWGLFSATRSLQITSMNPDIPYSTLLQYDEMRTRPPQSPPARITHPEWNRNQQASPPPVRQEPNDGDYWHLSSPSWRPQRTAPTPRPQNRHP